MEKYKKEWFGSVKADVLAGMVVAIALIPEAIGFSILAGVDPMVGLYASFCIAFVTSFFGGRPGLISAATGAMALLFVGLVRDHGLQYVLAATILAGVFQLIFGFAKIGNLLRFIPRPVMIVVSISTFEWSSIKRIKKVPKTDTTVLLATIIVVILTDNLAYGVIVGIIMSALFFVYKISGTEVEQEMKDGILTFKCVGQLFFASTTHFIHAFDIDFDVKEVIIDVSNLKLWDESAVDAIDKIYLKYISKGIRVDIIGLSPSCLELLEGISRHCPILPQYQK